jgi:hypothetical protein
MMVTPGAPVRLDFGLAKIISSTNMKRLRRG